MIHNDLNATILYLFNRYWDEDLTEDEEDAFDEEAELAINTYGWSTVFEAANSYLRNNCKDPASVINFAHHYWIYGWHNNDIRTHMTSFRISITSLILRPRNTMIWIS